MSYLIFDTETSGFPNPNVSPKHPAQAHICQLAILQLDSERKELTSTSFLVKPEGKWKVSEGAYKVHGISTEMCEDKGISSKDMLDIYTECHRACHSVVGHNLKFDLAMIGIELECMDAGWLGDKKHICTMEAMTPIMRLPQTRKNAFGKLYKWPKLEEAYNFVTKGGVLDDAHDALVDVRATADILRYLYSAGLIKN